MRMETAAVRLAAKTSAGGGQVGKNAMQELRLRLGMPPELVLSGESRWLGCCVSREDLNYCINAASRYSPWAAATTAQGYLTAPGGHRIGLCGEVVCKDGVVTGIREISSLCIRVARDFPGIAKRAADVPGSILILGAPGWGKTTLLRDLIRQIGEKQCVSVVDERGELFPEGLERGKKTDILTGCPKSPGIDMVLRTMGPDCIAVDEITAEADARALLRAANCGVRLLATAHGTSAADLRRRSVYRSLAESGVFQTLLILRQDKSFRAERAAL